MAKKLEVQFAVIDKATSELNRISREFNGFSERVNRFGMAARNIFAGAATVGAVDGLRRMITAGIEYGSRIDDMSKRTGMSVEQIQKLDFIAKQCGTSFESLSRAVLKLQVSASQAQSGNDKMAEAFRTLGVNVKDADRLLENTLIAISKIENPTRRAAAAQSVFGKGAGEMLQIIGQGEPKLREMIENFKSLGGPLTADMISKLDEAGDKVEMAKGAFTRLSAVLAVQLAPAIQKAAEFWSQLIAEMSRSPEEKQTSAAEKEMGRLLDNINKLKIARHNFQQPGYKKSFSDWWNLGSVEEIDRQIAVQQRLYNTQKAFVDGMKAAAPKPAAVVPGGTGDGGFGGDDKDDKNRERAQEKALQNLIDFYEKDAEVRFNAAEKAKEDALKNHSWELDQQDKADQLLLQMQREFDDKKLAQKKDTEKKEKAIEAAKSDFVRDVTLAGIVQMGEATQAMATNAKARKRIALVETVAYGGVSSALAWKEAFASAPGEFYAKLAAAIIGTGAAVANTAVALATINQYATGTRSAAGGLALVGEQGPELVRMPAGASVMTAGETRNVYNNNNAQTTIVVQSGGVTETFKAAIRSGAADRVISDLFARARGMRLMPA